VSYAARRLTLADADAYKAIRIEGLSNDPASFGSSLAEEGSNPPAFWTDRLNNSFMFGLFDGDRLVGTAGFYLEGMEKIRHRAHLVGVYLCPAVRGRGAAKILLEPLIGEARRQALQLHLAVTTDNEPARRLYERMGFVIYGTDLRGLRVDGRFYDDYLMVLRLDEGSRKVTENE
jgi:RimJ/RimL family protein N-acetyltransferase